MLKEMRREKNVQRHDESMTIREVKGICYYTGFGSFQWWPDNFRMLCLD
jgi:hypothetical protein